MNALKLLLMTIFAAGLAACGDNKEESTMSSAMSEAAKEVDEATKKAQEEAAKLAEELEDLENQ